MADSLTQSKQTFVWDPSQKGATWYALAAGAFGVLGLPSGPSPIALVVALVLLIYLVYDVVPRRGAWLGFLFGLSYFGLGFSWLLTSLHTYGGISMGLALLMLFLLSATMALYPALFGMVLSSLAPKIWLLPLAAPALWTLTEWLRTRVLGGFPWNLIGYAWDPWLPMIQAADLGGVFFLSWLLMFPASVVAVMWLRRSSWRETLVGLAIIAVIILSLFLYGKWRIESLIALQNRDIWAPPIRVAIVQANIAQHLKWEPKRQKENMERYLQLSRSLKGPLDLVVWPETAVAFFLQASSNYLNEIGQLSKDLDAPVLTGAPMADREKDGQWRFYNSMILLDDSDTLSRRYDKHHLVPFGEFIPFRGFVPSVFEKFTEGTEDFTPGPGPVSLPWSGGNIGPLICYEVIFPHEVRQLTSTGAKWLVNITNDAWFGESAKPQHLAMARMRAVENRRPLIRAANTGISTVFDHMGRQLGRIDANQMGTMVATVHQSTIRSLYQRSGHLWVWIWVYLCGASWLIGWWRNVKEK